MNKPTPSVEPDPDLGPLDGNGQQIWSPQEEAVLGNLARDPTFRGDIAEAEADIIAGRCYTHEEVVEMSAERLPPRRSIHV